MSPILTLITDFGLKDGNVGVMKGVILSICPQAQIVDLSHLISPQNVPEAALILARSAPYFSAGTVHVVVVDPGVGTARRALAARLGDQYFVGPDNGIITYVYEKLKSENQPLEFAALDQPRYWLPQVSHVFHGRDIFAPAAAHLANHVPLTDLGTIIDDPVLLHLPRPRPIDGGLRGDIIHIDHFGNAASNITREYLAGDRKVAVRLGDIRIDGMVQTFGERNPGEVVALFGSTGNLIVSVVNGSAAQELGVKVGDPLEVFWRS